MHHIVHLPNQNTPALQITSVIIPANNEEQSIGLVVSEIPKGLVREIIVCNNNSSDKTKEVAIAAGAIVVDETRAGYGWACLKGMEYLANLEQKPDIVVFLDGDHSDYPEEMPNILAPILNNTADLVIGSRALGQRQKGSMTVPQRFGNWLSTRLIRLFYRVRFTDLGPFRAIRYDSLMALAMKDKTYGWTVEMQIKAAKKKMRCVEVPVNYRKRIGTSKVSGTIKGVVMAGIKILWCVFRYI